MANNFSHRIYHAEVQPPGTVWPAIASELDNLRDKPFVQKLAQASEEPPAAAWQNIVSVLDARESARKSALPMWRWAAAAVFAGLIIYSAGYWWPGGNSSSTAHEKTVSAMPAPTNPPATNSKPDNMTQTPETPAAAIAGIGPFATKKNRHSAIGSPTDRIRYASIENIDQSTSGNMPEPDNQLNNYVSSNSGAYIPPPEYYFVNAPNGQRVKISSKFSEAVNSLFADDKADYSWKTRFDSWKNKLMANPSFIPAAGNFLDIAELKDLLKEQ